MQKISEIGQKIGFFLLSWILGGLFIIGGIAELFQKPLVGFFGIIIGGVLVRAWFRRNKFQKKCLVAGKEIYPNRKSLIVRIILTAIFIILSSLFSIALKDIFHLDGGISSFAGLALFFILIKRFLL